MGSGPLYIDTESLGHNEPLDLLRSSLIRKTPINPKSLGHVFIQIEIYIPNL